MDPDFKATVQTTGGDAPHAPLVTPATSASGTIQLFHGTDLVTARWIAEHGVNFEAMASYLSSYGDAKVKPDYFWTSTNRRTACDYAYLNNAVNMTGATPAVLSFRLSLAIVAELTSSSPPLVEMWSQEDADYRFSPACFGTLSAAMTDVSVTHPANVQFDE